MRGNLGEAEDELDGYGSIPAHAGQLRRWWSQSALYRVYPRACGATKFITTDDERHKGLSPRMRGNRVAFICMSSSPGSIPAHAGQPAMSAALLTSTGVYPRACGAT